MKLFFFGNYFYGLCAIALSIETLLRLSLPINLSAYFVFLFSSTVVYYTLAYTQSENIANYSNERTLWYSKNRAFIKISQLFFSGVAVVLLLLFLHQNYNQLLGIQFSNVLCLLLFPVVALFYYGIGTQLLFNLRMVGWLKPFAIGFVWAGICTIYPTLYVQIVYGLTTSASELGFLFLQNFIFISVLCIMFDIKDYAADYNKSIQTFVVKIGLRKTIFYIITPIILIYASLVICESTMQNFRTVYTVFLMLPIAAMLLVASSLKKRQSIFYYLVVIDGLMLFKAISCGAASLLFL